MKFTILYDNVGNKGNGSSLFARNPESILKRQENAKLLRGFRRSIANNASGRINSPPVNNEEDATAIPRNSKILHELNIHRDNTPKVKIGRVTCFSSRKRNLTYTLDQKKSLSRLNFEQECKRSLNFNKQDNGENNFKYNYRKNDYKENLRQILPPVDLTNTKVEGSMLRAVHYGNGDISKQSNTENFKSGCADSNIYLKKYQKNNGSGKGNKISEKKFHSKLPVLKLSAATISARSLISSKYNKVTNINKSPRARKSMSALSSLHRNTDSSSATKDRPIQKHSFSENDDNAFSNVELKPSCGTELSRFVMPSTISIKVTKPSLSLDEEADNFARNCDDSRIEIIEKIDHSSEKFQRISELQIENNYATETVINAALTKRNVSAVSCTKLEPPLNIPSSFNTKNHIFLERITQGDAGNFIDLPVINAQAPSLSQDLSVKSIQEILMQISQERKQIIVAMDEICNFVQTKAKAVIERFESSIEPLENLLKLKLANDDKIRKVDETSRAARIADIATLYETSMRITDYSFLGTPMPTKKKRLARSLSHPQAITETQSLKNGKKHPKQKFNTTDEKNSSFSAEELSPFTNLVGDCERASLAPMTPITRHNLFNLKENLNQQLDLLFD